MPSPTPQVKSSMPSAMPASAKKGNVWMIVSIILAIALIATVAMSFSGGIGGGKVSAQKAGDMLMSFINEVYGSQVGPATLKDISEENGIYKATVSVSVSGQPTDQIVFVSTDGKLFIPQVLIMADVTEQFRQFEQTQGQGAGLEGGGLAPTDTAPTDTTVPTN